MDQFLALWKRVEAGELTPIQAQEDAFNLGAGLGEGICVNAAVLGWAALGALTVARLLLRPPPHLLQPTLAIDAATAAPAGPRCAAERGDRVR